MAPIAAASACTSTSTVDTAFSGVEPPVSNAPLPPPASPAAEDAPVAPDAAPASGPATADAGVARPDPGVLARNTGAYPNINVEPPPASTHITDAERAALLAEMRALQAGVAAGRVSPEASAARLAELERLAATHSEEVLRRIEGRQ
ncbi:hypothetical protein [Roseitalea porphyridii]|uniref:Uncharacterized protein n=1 Tax=Roseitalea porphyridii TaxID=1852022 RepID=A0A4P6V0M2_9HYPH|nr:hypothetical protein [Roseitalea porphyridii]QBK30861.1 hypothetical protein E0E05_09805 [Roseitalea porphyridii]